MTTKLISINNLARYHQKFLEHYDARVLADEPSGGDDADYLETLFAQGRVILRPKAHYIIGRTIILAEGTDVDMNGAVIEYTGPDWDDKNWPDTPASASNKPTSGCAFLNVNNPWPASSSNAERSITEYNGRSNMRFRNGSFLNCAFGFLHAHDLVFEDLTFGEISTNGHVFQLAACKNVSFNRCTFHGVAKSYDNSYGNEAFKVSTEVINLDISTNTGQFIGKWFLPKVNNVDAATWDDYACRDITVENCVFRPNNNSVYSDVVGYHANFMQPYDDEVSPEPKKGNQFHKCIRVTNNYIYGMDPITTGNTRYTIAFKIRHMQNSVFANNICENVQSFALIDHVRRVTITGNVIKKNSNNAADTFDSESTWHTWGTGTVVDPSHETTNKGYYTKNGYLNIAGNNYARQMIKFDPADRSIYQQPTPATSTTPEIPPDWIPNPQALPRYIKDGITISLRGRIKPGKALTLNKETTIMTLPAPCRPSSPVAWVNRGDSYTSPNNIFLVLVKIKTDGTVTFTPLVSSVSLTTLSDIWIDGVYII